jgi:hypothetical protein
MVSLRPQRKVSPKERGEARLIPNRTSQHSGVRLGAAGLLSYVSSCYAAGTPVPGFPRGGSKFNRCYRVVIIQALLTRGSSLMPVEGSPGS